jgi:type II secretory ATPase GspE/PulE/Tfp pilus assembly ATPase PilB-like protein/ActR/RegA family two-component response regulator
VRTLLDEKLLDEEAVASLRAVGSSYASAELLRLDILTKKQLAEAVKARHGVAFEELTTSALGKLALSLISERLCRKHNMVPFGVEEDHIDLLMADPTDMIALDDAASVSGRRPVPFFGLPDRVEDLIAEGYNSAAAVWDILKKLPEGEALDSIQDGRFGDHEKADIAAPIARLTDGIIAQAVRMGASDIHIEQEESSTAVRYRVDGDLRSMMTLPKSIGAGPLVSRIKIMADLDVADHRLPQDGAARFLVGKQVFALRVSTIPTSFGEKAVVRILDPRKAQEPLEALGFRPDILARLVQLYQSDQGLLLITGPTGSGKTTTLYTCLNQIKSSKINVVTVEDPIEYRLSGINQVQVNEKAGLTFAAVLRSVLRQDPDVLLVGEIRDVETADIALKAALTGHMVFSTLHTNDAVSTINRLLDMGVEKLKLAPALVGIVSQRLVRRVCDACRFEERPSDFIAALLKKWGLPIKQFKGKGCEKCLFSGLHGRTSLVELLDLSDEAARDLVGSDTDTGAFRARCLERGWLLTLEEDVLWHLAHGAIEAEQAMALLRTAKVGPPQAAPSARPKARRILVVDDLPANLALIRGVLAGEDYVLSEAKDGSAALDMIRIEKPDLVLLDLMMPGIDGIAVLKRVRGPLGLMDLPILILTATGEADAQSLALETGADDYLTKPFIPAVLKARIKALLRRSEFRAR